MSISHRQKLSQLPKYLLNSIGAETSDFEFKNPDDKTHFELAYHVDQMFDQIKAYEFADAELKRLDIHEMEEWQFIHLFLSIHRIAARSLMMGKTFNDEAGDYIKHSVNITRETGVAGLEYIPDDFNHNYEVIKQIHGQQDADAYMAFVQALFPKIKAVIKEKPKLSEAELMIEVMQRYADDRGCQLYAQTFYVIDPKTAPQKLKHCMAMLKQKIANQNDPVDIAAYVLYRAVMDHVLPHGNRRTTRTFISWLLASLGVQPILIPKTRVQDYYQAIENCTEENIQPLADLLREFAQNEQKDLVPITEWSGIFTCVFQESYQFKFYRKYFEMQDLRTNAIERIDTKFYFGLSEHFQQILPEAGTYFYQQAQQIFGVCPLVSLAPNETARLSAAQAQSTGVVVFLQSDRWVLRLRDEHKNSIITHVDACTDLAYLAREAKALPGKQITVDIFKHKKDTRPRGHFWLLEAIENHLGKAIVNASGSTNLLRDSETGYLVFAPGKILHPQEMDILPLVPANRVFKNISSKNPLCEFKVVEGHLPVQARMINRLISQCISDSKEQPVVVYDNAWTGEFRRSTSVEEELSQKALELKDNPAQQVEWVLSQAKKNQLEISEEETKNFAQRLTPMWPLRNNILQTNLYSHLQACSFFSPAENKNKEEKQEMPGKALHLIADYLQSEEETAYMAFKDF